MSALATGSDLSRRHPQALRPRQARSDQEREHSAELRVSTCEQSTGLVAVRMDARIILAALRPRHGCVSAQALKDLLRRSRRTARSPRSCGALVEAGRDSLFVLLVRR